MTAARVSLEGVGRLASKLDVLSAIMKGAAIERGLERAGNAVAKRAKELVPKPGSNDYSERRGKRKAKKMLVDTIGHVIRGYQGRRFSGRVLVVGPQYPAGAHGHLVEYGHRIVRGGTVARVSTSRSARRSVAMPRSKVGRSGMGKVVGKTRAIPFMVPALKDTQGKIAGMLSGELVQAIGSGITRG